MGKEVVAYLEKVKKKGRGKRLAKVAIVIDKKGRIVRGHIIADIDRDKKPDSVTFWKRKTAPGYAANVSLSSQKKRRARKKKKR